MKKTVLAFLLSLCFLTSACSENQQQLYVKNVALSKTDDIYRLSVVYYDFSQGQEQYKIKEYSDSDIYKVGIKAMSDNNYNFRLCENVFLYPEIFLYDIDKAVYMINGLKISPNANIVCYVGQQADKFDRESESVFSPLYNLSVADGHVSGRFPAVSGNGRGMGTIIVLSGAPVTFTRQNTDIVVSMLTNNAKNAKYTFRDNQMWANLEGISTRFYIKDKILNIEISMSLKDYKGIMNSIQSKNVFINLLKADISNKVYEIYEDLRLSRYYNLHWFCDMSGVECESVKVKINII